MTLTRKQVAAIFFASVALAAFAAEAMAKPRSHRAARAAAAQAPSGSWDSTDARGRQSQIAAVAASEQTAPVVRSRRRGRRVAVQAAAPETPVAMSSFGSSDVVSEARRYIGTNPTGRGSLWCGAFMDMVLKRTGHRGGGNLASAYARYGTRIAGPQVGAIAVMGRRGGGHVGVVSGIDSAGNPIIISGNHNRAVAEAVYPRGRITAYVMP